MQALTLEGLQFQFVSRPVFPNLERLAWLHRGQDADEPGGHLFAFGDGSSMILFAGGAGGQVFDRCSGTVGKLHGGLTEPVGDGFGVGGILLEEHVPQTQPGAKSTRVGQPEKCPAKPDAVESGQNPLDVRFVTCEK